jgi:hypothetical protein
MCLALGIHDPHPLLGKVTRLDAAACTQCAHHLGGQPVMLTRDAQATATVNIAEQRPRTTAAIGNPEVIRLHGLEHRLTQRALLRVAIFTRKDVTWKDVAHSAVDRFVYHE